MKLIVGVVTYNSPPAELARFLRSLARARDVVGARAEIGLLSIDNGEAADWPAMPMPHRALPTAGNVGFAVAANRIFAQGFGAEQADAVLLANPDGAFHPDSIAHLLDTHGRDPSALVEARQFPEEHPKDYDPSDGTTDWVSGCCLLVPRAIWDRLGGFDERFFLYMEDIDLSWRAKQAGFHLRVAPRALFMHDVIRAHDQARHRQMVLARRALAHKWNAQAARMAAEQELAMLGCPPEALPPLGAAEPGVSRADVFDRHRSYLAEGRW